MDLGLRITAILLKFMVMTFLPFIYHLESLDVYYLIDGIKQSFRIIGLVFGGV